MTNRDKKMAQNTTMKLENSMYDIRLQMFRKGGSFVRKLAELMGTADLENQQIAINAWPEIFHRYDAFATLAKQDEPTFRNFSDEE